MNPVGNGQEGKSLSDYYAGTFEALNNPWSNASTNPFIDNPTLYGDFSDGHPAKVLLALSYVELLVADIANDIKQQKEAEENNNYFV